MTKELAVKKDSFLTEEKRESMALQIDTVKYQIELINQLYRDVLLDGVHYGTIPGTPKPTLYKAGAEEIIRLFSLQPDFDAKAVPLGGDHLMYEVKCTLTHNGVFKGAGLGSANTKEKKHRWRTAERRCPKCGSAAVIKGKEEYGGGWICWKKKGGCDAKFPDNDPAMLIAEKVENPDISDQYNTILKMAKKRAFVDAVLTIGGVSSIFVQDIEDASTEEPASKQELLLAVKIAIDKMNACKTVDELKNVVTYLKAFKFTEEEQDSLNSAYFGNKDRLTNAKPIQEQISEEEKAKNEKLEKLMS